VLSNYKFYAENISKYNILDSSFEKTLKSIGNSISEIKEALRDGFVSSTPSICFSDNGKLIVNLRYVDYKINEKGGYENRGQISTKNVISIMNLQYDLMNGNKECWEIEKEFILNYNTEHDGLYVGLEDVRLFTMEKNDEIFFNANRGLGEHKMVVEHGAIQLTKEQTMSGFISIEKQRSVEKNWVLFENHQHQQKIIYGWNPLIIGDIAFEGHIVSTKKLPNMQFMKTNEINTPRFFKDLRGSTNGVLMIDENEVWFLCHVVSYEERRFYYHIFVVLDATTYQVKKYTPYFTFEREKVEYSLGFVYFEEQDELLIGYSIMDRETKYMRIKKQIIEDKMIQNV
jgi:hypothetical protein